MSWQATDDQDYPRMTRMVQALIVINVAVAFLGATIVRSDTLVSLFAFRQGPIAETWWTAFTYMFLHAGLLHLAFNLYTTVPEPARLPCHQPFSIGPPDSTIAGMFTVAAAMMQAGAVLSQPVVSTTPSSG